MGIGIDRYWVIDVEGSGSTPPEIVELAMLEVADLKLTGNKRHWLVRPKQPIEASATRIPASPTTTLSARRQLRTSPTTCCSGSTTRDHRAQRQGRAGYHFSMRPGLVAARGDRHP